MSHDRKSLEIFILSSRFPVILRLSLNGETENSLRYLSSVLVLIAVLALAGCMGSDSESGEHSGDSEPGESRSESESGESRGDSESGEHGVGTESGDGGEEAGTQFSLDETFDEIRAGARLVLSYDPASNAFIGNVENTTDTTLRRVRVEVHLSNGIELGPTTPADLAPGQSLDITLPATERPFTTWSAHPEVG